MAQDINLNKGNTKKFIIILTSAILGAGLGLFIYTYLLATWFPPLSKRCLALTLVISLVASISFYFLILKIAELPDRKNITVLLFAGFISFIILYFGLEGRIPDSKYPVFLLPKHTLEIVVKPSQNKTPNNIKVLWFKTSYNEISFNELDYEGWERVGDELDLVDNSENHIKWTGAIGDEATLIFSTSSYKTEALISWDGKQEKINLFSENQDEYIYQHKEAVPFYASKIIVVILGFVSFLAIFYRLGIFLKNRNKEFFSEDQYRISGLSTEVHWQKQDTYLLIFLIMLTLTLRIFNLENLPPYVDEYSHLLTAKEILSGKAISQVYQRGLYLVTLPLVEAFKIFGIHLWTARLVGVIINSLAVIPLYLIGKKINGKISILACMLYATNPWIISVARNIREYGLN